jgi:hypothetical protein
LEEASDQQAGAGEQHEREGDLGYDQCAAELVPGTADGASAAFFQRCYQVCLSGPQRRGKTKENAGEHRYGESEQ